MPRAGLIEKLAHAHMSGRRTNGPPKEPASGSSLVAANRAVCNRLQQIANASGMMPTRPASADSDHSSNEPEMALFGFETRRCFHTGTRAPERLGRDASAQNRIGALASTPSSNCQEVLRPTC
jgi:hypothetical protein